MSQMVIEVEKLEKKLKESSKARETKLQKASAKDRLSLAFQIKIMDDEVIKLTRLLALRSLQLQMEYIYRTLEDEALDIVEDPKSSSFIRRQGSTEELLLLTAEFSLLEDQLRALMKRMVVSQAALVADSVLQSLVDDIEDLRRRLGIRSDVVFGDSALTWRKVTLQIEEAFETIQEGINFLIRGFRLMGSDLIYASRLFSKAAIGSTQTAGQSLWLDRRWRVEAQRGGLSTADFEGRVGLCALRDHIAHSYDSSRACVRFRLPPEVFP